MTSSTHGTNPVESATAAAMDSTTATTTATTTAPFLSWPRSDEEWESAVRALTPYAEELWSRLELLEAPEVPRRAARTERAGRTERYERFEPTVHSPSHSARVYTVVGLLPGDGASTIAAALAHVAVRAFGLRVLLVEADLRDPSLLARGLAPRCAGLAGVLRREARLRGVVFDLPRTGFCVLPAGRVVENPTSVIDPARIAALLRAVETAFDVVVLDSPPLSTAPETRHLVAAADATIPVLRSGRTLPETAGYWIGKIGEYGGRVGAVCLNGVEIALPARLRALF